MSMEPTLMADTEWDLISNCSEQSDLYWPESEYDGEESEGYDSASDNGFGDESGESDSEFNTLSGDETGGETETSDGEEEREEDEAVAGEEALPETAEEEGDAAGHDEGIQDWGADEGAEDEEQDSDDEHGDSETLVGSHSSVGSESHASLNQRHNVRPAVFVEDEESSQLPPQTLAME